MQVIEQLFGVAPDGGSGVLELLILAAVLMVVAVLVALFFRRRRVRQCLK